MFGEFLFWVKPEKIDYRKKHIWNNNGLIQNAQDIFKRAVLFFGQSDSDFGVRANSGCQYN